ncbi:hypothetical protein Pfo_006389 [Paulownia fortunei]|nr:hypothetical protein Pfo_006389 [Paulownia fortunei]
MTDVLILKAAANGDLEGLQELKVKIGDDEHFRRRCDISIDCEGRRSLHYAAGKGLIQICKFLIEEMKVDINIKTEKGNSPLLLAAARGHVNTAEYLINQGADISMSNYKGITCLHLAAVKDNKELMQLLLMKGADIETDSVLGTPLQCAASRGRVESVRFLLGHGANPNSVSLPSVSPLMWAIFQPSFECFELLLKAGADPNIGSLGSTPLAFAARQDEGKFLRPLLEAGANPNSVTTACLKPIEHAAWVGNLEGVKILFPETQSIPNYPDWSIHGIMNYFHSEEAEIQREQTQIAYFQLVDKNGKNAAKRNDYLNAVKWFSEAIYLDSSVARLLSNRARLLSNRSICWAHLHQATFSLCDAKECVKLKPDWPKAHYREGVAWMLLKNYVMAFKAFWMASTLKPGNEEIEKAYCEALRCGWLDLVAKHPLEAVRNLQNSFDFPGSDAFYSELFDLAANHPLEAENILQYVFPFSGSDPLHWNYSQGHKGHYTLVLHRIPRFCRAKITAGK